MTQDIQDFIQYLHNEKQTSANTEVSYERDLRKMNEFLCGQGVDHAYAVLPTHLMLYVMDLEKSGKKPATISRSIASMKAFFHYMEKPHRINEDPTE